ncbi:MAG: hypothetical protein ABSB76_11275, partial [Streptosporangiaceae bacterium]
MLRHLNGKRVKRGRWLRGGALSGACAVALTAGLAGGIVPAAQAASPFFEVGFQNNDGTLSLVGAVDNGASGFTIMPGTSPSLTQLSTGGFEVAFQNTTGSLITWGPDGVLNWGAEKAGTSPSITAMPSGEYEVAYVGVDGIVDTTGDIGAESWFAAAPGTSPSIAPIFSGEGYEVAFQGSNHNLWTVNDEGGVSDNALGMMAGTSPSVAELQDGGYEVAFQANTGSLWTMGTSTSPYDYNLGMMAGTSP